MGMMVLTGLIMEHDGKSLVVVDEVDDEVLYTYM